MFPCLALRIQSCTGSRALPHSHIKAGATGACPPPQIDTSLKDRLCNVNQMGVRQAKLVPRCILSSLDRKPSVVVDISAGICVDGHKTAGKNATVAHQGILTSLELNIADSPSHTDPCLKRINLSEAVPGRVCLECLHFAVTSADGLRAHSHVRLLFTCKDGIAQHPGC